MAHILIIDDRPGVRAVLAHPIRRAGHDVHESGSLTDGLLALRSFHSDIAFVGSHARSESDNGNAVSQIIAAAADTTVVVFTCSGNVADAVHAIKAGAHDYLQLPIEPEHLVRLLRGLLDDRSRPSDTPAPRRHAPAQRPQAERVVAADVGTRRLFEKVRRVADVDCTVLITGESGTGKEVVAWSIFDQSRRRSGRFVPLNCGAIPDSLAESELFGYHKGAFTGATCDRPGLIEEAENGVLFLDEIGEMSPRLQVMLLRFLDSAEVRRVGDTAVRHVNTRVVAATNRPLEDEVQRGAFRHDLFYRLAVVSLHVPPLRERHDDVPALVNFFLRKSAARLQQDVRAFSDEAFRLLCGYDWPGNVRELQNVVEGALVLTSDEVVGAEHLPAGITDPDYSSFASTSRGAELATMAAAVERFGGNQTQAAAALGVSRTTLWRKLRRSHHRGGPVGTIVSHPATAMAHSGTD